MEIVKPDTTEIERESTGLFEVGKSLIVVTHEDYMTAGEHLKANKRLQKKVEELFAAPKEAAWSSHKSIVAAEKKLLEPLKIQEKEWSVKVQSYLIEKKRLEDFEFARRRKIAEEEQERIAATERLRQEDQKLKLAISLEQQGFKEESQEVLNQEVIVVPDQIVMPKVIDENPKVEGVFTRKSYKAKVDNLKLLVDEIAAGRQPLNLIVANESVLNKMAQALKKELRIPGVSVIENFSITTRLD